VLIICAVVQTTLQTLFGDHPSKDWIDGLAIIFAIVVVVLVGSINNYIKEKEFREFQRSVNSDRKVNIIRYSEDKEIKEADLLVGDLMKLEEGMTIPVDCLLVSGSNVSIDESAMTGEIDPVEKAHFAECMKQRQLFLQKYPDYLGSINETSHNKIKSPVIPSGTLVTSGNGLALVIAVGPNSERGKIIATIEANQDEDESTPLQEKLVDVAEAIGKLGLLCAVITSLAMAIKVFLMFRETQFTSSDAHLITRIFIIGVVVVVVAIPEGLPLAVTITLALSIKKMLKDKNLVRRLDACETMGGANYICTDKTGTLTKNEMNIVRIHDCVNDKNLEDTCAEEFTGEYSKYFTEKKWNLIKQSFACNSATEITSDGKETSTFKTDLTFTKLLAKLGENVKDLRSQFIKPIDGEIPRIAFSSKRKRMSTILTSKHFTTKYRLYIKGASEIILNSCKKFIDENGNLVELNKTKRDEFTGVITRYAKKTLRTICICYKDITEEEARNWNYRMDVLDENNMMKEVYPIEEENLNLIAIVGIRDILKEGVKEAVVKCQNSGITVIMVTGDNIDTAFAIAKECYIAHDESEAILGERFMEKIGGVVCENCYPVNEYLSRYEEMVKVSEEANKKKNYKILQSGLAYNCNCYRTKEEAIMKIKSKLKEEVLSEDPDKYAEIVRDADKKEEFDNELQEKAEKIIEESNIKIRKDVIPNMEKFKTLIDKKRVIARSMPHHKYALVLGLKELDNVVAVTGDGTNDAPALSKADVGFSMGKGTDIAKEASDIIIVDDNFSSIINAIKWGRNVYDNIRRFLQFQLTVNVVACLLVFIGVCAGSESPLSAVQMLWLNMIMDSLGSLALATEEPTEELLERAPYKRDDFIINKVIINLTLENVQTYNRSICCSAYCPDGFTILSYKVHL
jgi:magnesium-transporting ATPase (P-type)